MRSKRNEISTLNVLGLILLSGLDELADEGLLVLGSSLDDVGGSLLLAHLHGNNGSGNGSVGGKGQLERESRKDRGDKALVSTVLDRH